jgi:hypothetical protein
VISDRLKELFEKMKEPDSSSTKAEVQSCEYFGYFGFSDHYIEISEHRADAL